MGYHQDTRKHRIIRGLVRFPSASGYRFSGYPVVGWKFFFIYRTGGGYPHFYSLNKITFAVTRQNKEYIIDVPLDKLMEQLDPDKFFRTNRQTIINIESIVKIEPYFQNKVIVHIKPEHKEKILVSKEKWASFKLWLNY